MIARLLIRSLLKAPAWCFGVVSLVALAVTIYAGTAMGTSQIQQTTDRVYRDLRLFDLDIHIEPTPLELLPSPGAIISKVDGIASITYRLLLTGTVELSGDRMAGAVISAVAPSRRPDVSDVLILRGSFLAPGHPDEVVIDSTFAKDMGLTIGDQLTLRVSTHEHRVKVIGLGVFSEFLMSSVNDNFSIPVRGTATAMMISSELVSAALQSFPTNQPLPADDTTIIYNSIPLKIKPGYPKETVLLGLRGYLEQTGISVVGHMWQEDQYSVHCHKSRMLTYDDFLPFVISVLNSLAFIAMLLLVLRMTKLYQRQIATLLALGVARHVILMQWTVAIGTLVAVGAAVGTAGAFLVAARVTHQYVEGAGFPVLFPEHSWTPLINAWLLSLALVPLGVTLPVVSLLSQYPARLFAQGASMWRVSWVLRLIHRLDAVVTNIADVGYPERLGLRNVARRPLPFFSSTLCIAGMLVMGSSMYVFSDGLEASFENYVSGQKWSYLVEFAKPKTEMEVSQLLKYAGVTSWEGLWVAERTLRFKGHERSYRLVAGPVPSRLREDRAIVFGRSLETESAQEIVVDLRTAQTLGIHVGDMVDVGSGDRTVSLRVVGITSNYSVNQAFVSHETINHVVGQPLLMQGAVLVGPSSLQIRLSRLNVVTRVLPGALLWNASLRNVNTVTSFFRMYGHLCMLVGAVLVLVFMSMTIEDRVAEYALLRSHGFTTSELLRSLMVEVLAIGIFAIAISFPLTKIVTYVFQLRFMETSDFFPLRMNFVSWLGLMGPALLFILASVVPVLRKAVSIQPADALRDRIAG